MKAKLLAVFLLLLSITAVLLASSINTRPQNEEAEHLC